MTLHSPYLDHLVSSLQEEHLYLIQRLGVDGFWFLFDASINPSQVLWTTSRRTAFKFPTEQNVEEFRAEYVSPRPVEIIRVERTLQNAPKQSVIIF